MNKKTLFLLILAAIIVLPVVAQAADITSMSAQVKDALVKVGGSIVIIGWVITGILYLTAAGSPEKLGTAKKALFAAVTGTILIILAVSAQQMISDLIK